MTAADFDHNTKHDLGIEVRKVSEKSNLSKLFNDMKSSKTINKHKLIE